MGLFDEVKGELARIPLDHIRIMNVRRDVHSPTIKQKTQVVLEYYVEDIKPKIHYPIHHGIDFGRLDDGVDALSYYLRAGGIRKMERTPKKKNQLEYQFHLQNMDMVNFDEIEEGCTKRNPLVCISAQDRRFILVHRNVLQKANILHIKPPKNWKQFKASSVSMIFEIMPNEFNIPVCKECEETKDCHEPKIKISSASFKRSKTWVRKVIKTPWGNEKNPVNVNVAIPNL